MQLFLVKITHSAQLLGFKTCSTGLKLQVKIRALGKADPLRNQKDGERLKSQFQMRRNRTQSFPFVHIIAYFL